MISWYLHCISLLLLSYDPTRGHANTSREISHHRVWSNSNERGTSFSNNFYLEYRHSVLYNSFEYSIIVGGSWYRWRQQLNMLINGLGDSVYISVIMSERWENDLLEMRPLELEGFSFDAILHQNCIFRMHQKSGTHFEGHFFEGFIFFALKD